MCVQNRSHGRRSRAMPPIFCAPPKFLVFRIFLLKYIMKYKSSPHIIHLPSNTEIWLLLRACVVSVEQTGDFCNPYPVQIFPWVIRSFPISVDLSKYFIQFGLNPKKLLLSILLQWSIQFGYHIWSGWVFFKTQSDPVLNCRIRLDRDPGTGSCSTLVWVAANEKLLLKG